MSEQPTPVVLAVRDLIGRRAYWLGKAFDDEQLAMRQSVAAARGLASLAPAGDHDAAGGVPELACDPPRVWLTSPLGVTTAAIDADLADGRLDRHPDGGVTLASVRLRVREERSDVR